MGKRFISMAVVMTLLLCVTGANAAGSVTATPTSSTVLVDGVTKSFDAYTINDNNYFKLRDLAYVLNGTSKQFAVGWNGATNAISLTSGQPYVAVGGEMESKRSGEKPAESTTSKVTLDEKEVSFTAYSMEGNNYFKLRDIGAAYDFSVEWDGKNSVIVIDTNKGYSPPDSKIVVDSTLLSRYGISYGELKQLLGQANPEFETNSKYAVSDSQSVVWYYFAGENWTVQDSDFCYKIQAPLGIIASGIDGQMSIEAFTKNLASYSGDASYQIKQGAGTAAYISDRYAEVHFSGNDGSGQEGAGFGAALYIELSSNDTVSPDSLTWLRIIAG